MPSARSPLELSQLVCSLQNELEEALVHSDAVQREWSLKKDVARGGAFTRQRPLVVDTLEFEAPVSLARSSHTKSRPPAEVAVDFQELAQVIHDNSGEATAIALDRKEAFERLEARWRELSKLTGYLPNDVASRFLADECARAYLNANGENRPIAESSRAALPTIRTFLEQSTIPLQVDLDAPTKNATSTLRIRFDRRKSSGHASPQLRLVEVGSSEDRPWEQNHFLKFLGALKTVFTFGRR